MNKIALLFPGQGTQYIGMGKFFYDNFSIAKQTLEEANDTLGFDLKDLCLNGNMEVLSLTENTQPAVLAVSIAMYRVFWQEIGIEPNYLAGHSLGEITALTCAESISFPDALKIVRERGRIMQNTVSSIDGTMLAVNGISQEIIETECEKERKNGKFVAISNYNSSEQHVISGHTRPILKIRDRLAKIGANIIPLQVSAPFHCILMEIAARIFENELSKYSFNILKWPVISNVNAKLYTNHDVISNLVQQMVKPVQWQTSMQFLRDEGINIAIEIGPKSVLKNLMKNITHDISAFSYDFESDRELISKLLSTASPSNQPNSENLLKLIDRCLAIAVCTRNRNWNNEEYQKGVIDPYKKIQALKLELEAGSQKVTVNNAKKALEMLCSVFITKFTPHEEQVERFKQIFSETGTDKLFPEFNILD